MDPSLAEAAASGKPPYIPGIGAEGADMKIAMIGDKGVGKTSLVGCVVSDTFDASNEQNPLPTVVIPRQLTNSPYQVYIVDTLPPEGSNDQMEVLKQSDVLVLVYDCDNVASMRRINTYWLDLLTKNQIFKPVVLVGNKVDLLDASQEDVLRERIQILNDILQRLRDSPFSREGVHLVECSAKTRTTVNEVFLFAQRAIMYPMGPILDVRNQKLQDKCAKALRRIFHILDEDADGILNDDEMIKMQKRCFNAPFPKDELTKVKEMVRSNIPNGMRNDGLTADGFLALQFMFVAKGTVEAVWEILRVFRYKNDLEVELYDLPEVHMDVDAQIELTAKAEQFLQKVFERFDVDKDGALSPTEWEQAFEIAGVPHPFGDRLPQFVATREPKHNSITRDGWLALWAQTAVTDFGTVLKFLQLWDFPHSEEEFIEAALFVTPRRKEERNTGRISKRRVLNALVFGRGRAGKTSVLRGLLNKLPIDKKRNGEQAASVCALVGADGVTGSYYLAMKEVTDAEVDGVFSDAHKIGQCDVALMVYDRSDPDSFSGLVSVQKKLAAYPHIPCIYVATKADLEAVDQVLTPPGETVAEGSPLSSPQAFCASYGLPWPTFEVSLKNQDYQDLFDMVVRVATLSKDTEKYRPRSSKSGASGSTGRVLKMGIAASAIGVAGFVLMRYLRK